MKTYDSIMPICWRWRGIGACLDISGLPPKNLSVVETRADLLQRGLSPNEEVH